MKAASTRAEPGLRTPEARAGAREPAPEAPVAESGDPASEPGPRRTADVLGKGGSAAWKAFLRAHSRLTRELDDELQGEHGFTLGDFDVMIQLAEAPRGRRRMCDLAAAVVLSPSGLSRRVDRLERAGYVARERAEGDARAVEARLTAAGKRLLRRLRATHLAGVRERFVDRYTTDELEVLAELLGRLRSPED